MFFCRLSAVISRLYPRSKNGTCPVSLVSIAKPWSQRSTCSFVVTRHAGACVADCGADDPVPGTGMADCDDERVLPTVVHAADTISDARAIARDVERDRCDACIAFSTDEGRVLRRAARGPK